MYSILFALVLSMFATPGVAEIQRSSMNLGVLHWAQAQYRYKRPPVSNLTAKEFPATVWEFRHDRVMRENITSCSLSAFVPDPLTGGLGARVGETKTVIPNEGGICDESSYKFGRDLSRYIAIAARYLDTELLVVPSAGTSSGKIEKDILLLVRIAEITGPQNACIAQVEAVFRSALASEQRSWLMGLGANVSIDLIDNSAGLDLEQQRRVVGIEYSGDSKFTLRAVLGSNGTCVHPSAEKLQEVLSGMNKWANAPKSDAQRVYWHR